MRPLDAICVLHHVVMLPIHLHPFALKLLLQVESVRAAEHAAEVERLQAEDATRSLDGDLASLRSRITQLEGQLKAKDKEVEKANRQADAAKVRHVVVLMV